MTEQPTVFHVDDDAMVRRAVELLVRSVRGEYLGFVSVNHYLETVTTDRPGCLVTDLRMPGLGGMELVRYVKARSIRVPVIVFTAYAEVDVAVAAMKSGAVDFIQKPASDQVLLEAIQAALSLDARRRAERTRHERTAGRIDTLNPGEREVLELVMQGKGNKEMAASLEVSYKTVEARRARLMEKMGHETLAGLLVDVIEWRAAVEN